MYALRAYINRTLISIIYGSFLGDCWALAPSRPPLSPPPVRDPPYIFFGVDLFLLFEGV